MNELQLKKTNSSKEEELPHIRMIDAEIDALFKKVSTQKELDEFILNRIYFDGPIVEIYANGNMSSIIVTTGTIWFMDQVFGSHFKISKIDLNDQEVTAVDFDGSLIWVAVANRTQSLFDIITFDVSSKEKGESQSLIPTKALIIKAIPSYNAAVVIGADGSLHMVTMTEGLQGTMKQEINLDVVTKKEAVITDLIVARNCRFIVARLSNGQVHKMEFYNRSKIDASESLANNVIRIFYSEETTDLFLLNSSLEVLLFEPLNDRFRHVCQLENSLEPVSQFAVAKEHFVLGFESGRVLYYERNSKENENKRVPMQRELLVFWSEEEKKGEKVEFLKLMPHDQSFCAATNKGKSPLFKIMGFEGFQETHCEVFPKEKDLTPTSICLGKDSKHFFVGTVEGQVIKYQINPKKSIDFLKELHAGPVTTLVCYKNAVVSAGQDGFVYFTDSEEGDLLKSYPSHHSKPIKFLLIGEPFLWSADGSSNTKVIHMESNEIKTIFTLMSESALEGAAISPDQRLSLVYGSDGSLEVFDFPSLRRVSSKNTETSEPVLCAGFSHDSKKIVFCTKGKVHVVFASSCSPLFAPFILVGDDSSPIGLFCSRGSELVFVLGRFTLKVFSLVLMGEVEMSSLETENGISKGAFSENGKVLGLLEENEEGKVIRVIDNHAPKTVVSCSDTHFSKVTGFEFGLNYFYSVDEEGHLFKTDMDSKSQVGHIHVPSPGKMMISASYSTIFVVSEKEIWEISTEAMERTHKLQMEDKILDFDISLDGLSLLVVLDSLKTRIYRTINWDLVSEISDAFKSSVEFCGFSTNQKQIICFGDKGILKIIDPQQKVVLASRDLSPFGVLSAKISRDPLKSLLVFSSDSSSSILALELDGDINKDPVQLDFKEDFFFFDFSSKTGLLAVAFSSKIELFDLENGLSIYRKELNEPIRLSGLKFSLESNQLAIAAYSPNNTDSSLAKNSQPHSRPESFVFIEIIDLLNQDLVKIIHKEKVPIASFDTISQVSRAFQDAEEGDEPLGAIANATGHFKIVGLNSSSLLLSAKTKNSSRILNIYFGSELNELIILYEDATVVVYDRHYQREISYWNCKDIIDEQEEEDQVFPDFLIVTSSHYDRKRNKLYIGTDCSRIYLVEFTRSSKEVFAKRVFKDEDPILFIHVFPSESPEVLYAGSTNGLFACISLFDSSFIKVNQVPTAFPIREIFDDGSHSLFLLLTQSILMFNFSSFNQGPREVFEISAQVPEEPIITTVHKLPKPVHQEASSLFAVGFENGLLGLFDSVAFQLIRLFGPVHNGVIRQIKASEDGRFLYTVSDDQTFKQIDTSSFDDSRVDLYQLVKEKHLIKQDKNWFSYNPYFGMCFFSYFILVVTRKKDPGSVSMSAFYLFEQFYEELKEYIASPKFSLPDFLIWHHLLYQMDLSDLMIQLGRVLYSADFPRFPVITNHLNFYLREFPSPEDIITYFSKKYMEIFIGNFFIPMSLSEEFQGQEEMLVEKGVFNERSVASTDRVLNKLNMSLVLGDISQNSKQKTVARVTRSRLDIFVNEKSNKSLLKLIHLVIELENEQLLANPEINLWINRYWRQVKGTGYLLVFLYCILFFFQYLLGFTFGHKIDAGTGFEIFCCVPQLLMCFFYIVYESFQLIQTKWSYLKSPQNWVDGVHIVLTIASTMSVLIHGHAHYYLYDLTLFVGIIRLLMLLQFLEQVQSFTYRLINLISDSKILFFFCALWLVSISLFYYVHERQSVSFYEELIYVYGFFTANWDNPELTLFSLFFFLSTVVLAVVMMNVLIVVVSESFAESGARKEGIDGMVKLRNILELFNANDRFQLLCCRRFRKRVKLDHYSKHFLYLFANSLEEQMNQEALKETRETIQLKKALKGFQQRVLELDSRVSELYVLKKKQRETGRSR